MSPNLISFNQGCHNKYTYISLNFLDSVFIRESKNVRERFDVVDVFFFFLKWLSGLCLLGSQVKGVQYFI